MIFILFIISIVLTAGVLWVVAPKQFSAKRELNMNAPAEKICSVITDYKTVKDWNPFQKQEPNCEVTITGNAGESGQSFAWKGKKIGEGKMTLLEYKPFVSVKEELVFIKPFPSISSNEWTLEEVEPNVTRVVWEMKGPHASAFTRILSPIMQGVLEKNFAKGLKDIKAICESKN